MDGVEIGGVRVSGPNAPVGYVAAYETISAISQRTLYDNMLQSFNSLFQGTRIASTAKATFIDIPGSALPPQGTYLQVTLRAVLSDGRVAERVSMGFNLSARTSNGTELFGAQLALSQKLTGESFGVNWDDRSVTNSCVITAREIVEHFSDFYGGVTIPHIAEYNGDFAGAARLMMDVEVVEDGQPVLYKEKDVPGFKKVYLNQSPGSIPPVGSLLIWNTNIGDGAGHIAIVSSNENGQVQVIDGNWFSENKIADGKNVHIGFGGIHYVNDLTNIIGWLVPTNR